jgi:hypothetical protein
MFVVSEALARFGEVGTCLGTPADTDTGNGGV